MASSLPESFGERPQKESQTGSGGRVDPPGLEFVRAVKELLEMGAAVMENPMVSQFITSTYQGLMNLADDSYPGNDIEWHESLAEHVDDGPEEDGTDESDPDEDGGDDIEDEADDAFDADDDEDDILPEEDEDEDDGSSDDPRMEESSVDEEETSDEELDDDDDFSSDDAEKESDDDEEDDDEEQEDEEEAENPRSRKTMAKLVTSLRDLSHEFQRFNAEFRRMKGKVD